MNITSYTGVFKIAAAISGANPCNQLCNYSKLGYLIQENVLILNEVFIFILLQLGVVYNLKDRY